MSTPLHPAWTDDSKCTYLCSVLTYDIYTSPSVFRPLDYWVIGRRGYTAGFPSTDPARPGDWYENHQTMWDNELEDPDQVLAFLRAHRDLTQ